jgi:hypothetical protein
VNDQFQTNLISKEGWKTHYTKPWFNPDVQEKREEEMGGRTEEEGETAVEELELALKWTKTRKTADRDSLNVNIFKCRSTEKLLIA